jgi:integrase
VFADGVLRQELVKHGAPVDFYAHAMRHTVATWLQSKGHSEWEIGLVLNHAGSGVTAGYSHSYPLGRKRELLGKWSCRRYIGDGGIDTFVRRSAARGPAAGG